MWDFKKNANEIAIITEDKKIIKYAELDRMQRNFASYLLKRKVILIICSNTLECLVGYISCIKNGVIPIMISEDMYESHGERYIKLYKPEYVWRNINQVHVIIHNGYRQLYNYGRYSLFVNDNHLMNKSEEFQIDNRLALLLTTSGTTGSEKLVRLSLDNLESNTISIVNELDIKKGERAITVLPINYSYGLSVINTHLYVGGTILLSSKSILQKEFWDFFITMKGNSLSGTPYHYYLLDKMKFYQMEILSLKTMTQAGGALDIKLYNKFYEFSLKNKIRFCVMYGQTEATARICMMPDEYPKEFVGSVGRTLSDGEVLLIDENNNEIIQDGIEGELVYVGKSTMLGYAYGRQDLSLGDINKGILHTNDLGYKNGEYFYITKRKGREVKVFGNRIDLDSLEKICNEITENICACIHYKNQIYICVVSVGDKILVKQKYNQSIYKIIIVDRILRNENGKIQYQKLYNYILDEIHYDT